MPPSTVARNEGYVVTNGAGGRVGLFHLVFWETHAETYICGVRVGLFSYPKVRIIVLPSKSRIDSGINGLILNGHYFGVANMNIQQQVTA